MEIAPLSVPPPGAWPAAAGYPAGWPPATPPKAKWSKALWVFAALVVLLVTGLGVVGVVYANDKAVADRVLEDQQKQLDDLNKTINDRTKTISDRDAELTATRSETEDTAAKTKEFQNCSTTARQFLEAAEAEDTAKARSLLTPMMAACHASL
jgi:peptidoglycan hydrolase CwlO-like protein